MSKQKTTPENIADADLDQATGGVGLLLPAVQAVIEDEKSTDTLPAEEISLNYEEIKVTYRR